MTALTPAAIITLAFGVIYMAVLHRPRYRGASCAWGTVLGAVGVAISSGFVVADLPSEEIPVAYLLVVGLSLFIGDALVTVGQALWYRLRGDRPMKNGPEGPGE